MTTPALRLIAPSMAQVLAARVRADAEWIAERFDAGWNFGEMLEVFPRARRGVRDDFVRAWVHAAVNGMLRRAKEAG